jgi:hypothetical protein
MIHSTLQVKELPLPLPVVIADKYEGPTDNLQSNDERPISGTELLLCARHTLFYYCSSSQLPCKIGFVKLGSRNLRAICLSKAHIPSN